ncbi:MAG: ABC transporter permease [Planctomycetia bacterium]|nr:ABC transporter permease [Planctomycetia bacterium]
MVLWKFTVREILARPGRAALTLIGIVIGVASVVAVNLSTITTRHAYDEIFRNLAGRSDFEIVSEGDCRYVPARLTQTLEEVEGVDAVAPVCSRYTVLQFQGKRLTAQILGIDPTRDSRVRHYILDGDATFETMRGALVEKSFAEGLGLKKGDMITILTHRLRQRIEVGGLFQFRDAEGLVQASGLIVLPLDAVQYYFRMPEMVSRIDVVLKPETDETKAMEAIAKVTPRDLLVRIPSTRAQVGRDTIAGAEQGLNYSYSLSLLLAVVLILNTFMINVSERRRQLSILRAIGTKRGEIVGMLLREGLLFGVVGTLLGMGLGVIGAEILVRMSVDAHSAVAPEVIFSWEPFLLAAILGPGLSVASAYIPARLAAKVTPKFTWPSASTKNVTDVRALWSSVPSPMMARMNSSRPHRPTVKSAFSLEAR